MYSPERVNVLLSRARNGLIMIGNAETFTNARNPEGRKLWTRVLDLLRNGGHVYDGIPAKCERHPTREALLVTPEDFDRECPEGGCKEPWYVRSPLSQFACFDIIPRVISGAMLSCGIHSCASKCHQIYDHSKVTCSQVMDDRCPNGHKRVWRCHEAAPVICRKCEKEAQEADKKRQKEFERQQKRDAEEREHTQRIAKLDEEIAAEREAAQDRERAKQRADALAQKQKDLEIERARASKKAAAKAAANTTPVATTVSSAQVSPNTSSSAPANSSSVRTPSPEPEVSVAEPPDVASSNTLSPAEAEWQRQKDIEGAANDSIDSIMGMTGLENVKDHILRIKDKIDLANRQGISLKDERFNVVLLGNPGTGTKTLSD
jgi:hypothetical protein